MGLLAGDHCFMKVLRSPNAHARILAIDTSRAEKLPGVRAVVTGKDCPTRVSWMAPRLLALDEVIWAGQGVAAVAAETPEIAEEALQLIIVKDEPLPAVLDAEEARKPNPPVVVDRELGRYQGSPQFTPESPNISGHYKLRAGDIEKGFTHADVVVENRFSTSRVSHSQLELAGCIVRAEPDGGITMWTNGQGVHVIKGILCDLFQLPGSKVRVINPYQGGSFGNRLRYCVEPLATLLALKVKGTVYFSYSRREMFIASPSRLPVKTYIKTGAKRDGTIVAQQMEVVVDNGASYACLQDGRAEPFEIEIEARRRTTVTLGRARWMPDGRSIAFVGQDEAGASGVFVQDFAPGRNTNASRRKLAGFEPEVAAESFGISPDAKHLALAGWVQLFSLMEGDGLAGLLVPPRGALPE